MKHGFKGFTRVDAAAIAVTLRLPGGVGKVLGVAAPLQSFAVLGLESRTMFILHDEETKVFKDAANQMPSVLGANTLRNVLDAIFRQLINVIISMLYWAIAVAFLAIDWAEGLDRDL